MKRLGHSWISLRQQHPKTNPLSQEEFKKNPGSIRQIQARYPTKKIEVWFQDEARVCQQGTLTRRWAKKGLRPRAVGDFRFESAYIFGAICPASKKASALVFSQVGSTEMNLHLKEISAVLPSDVHAIINMDCPPWHTSVTIPENISIICLLP